MGAPVLLELPLEGRRFSNGLTVVVSEDRSAPVVGLCVLYRTGFRQEPRHRAGFAHLFEHLMFQGTPRTGKGLFDRICEASGGSNNGQTRPDVTLYVETFPASALPRFLWLEADRMRSLDLSQENLDNQRDVVKEEIRVNVQNDPYGLFEASALPAILFEKWENAHDGYGDFHDLDAATLEDVRTFFEAHYRPGNAVLAVAGGVAVNDVFEMAERFFGDLPEGEIPIPPLPDLHEGPRRAPHLVVQGAPLAETPALAVGWRMPPRQHDDAWPLLVAGELLHDGRAGRLYRGLVEGREIATEIAGGFNPFQGFAWYHGTTLFLSRIGYRRGVTHEQVLGGLECELARIASEGVPEAELARVKTKVAASIVHALESRLDRAVELALAAAFDGGAEAVPELPSRVAAVTSDDVQRAVSEWLGPLRRAVVVKSPR